jgi:hypothetical protein
MRIPNWLKKSHPIRILPKSPKDLPPEVLEARANAPIPEQITSDQIPNAVRRHIRRHLQQLDYYRRYPELDPTTHQNLIPRSVPIEISNTANSTALVPSGSDIGHDIIPVPNPFLRMRYVIENFAGLMNARPKFRDMRLVNRRHQMILLARNDPWTLPPSPYNPLSKVPRIQWVEKDRFEGAEIEWKGAWEEKVKKGIYNNRAVVFKGKRREREREEKAKEVAERMEGMEERIARWREVSLAVLVVTFQLMRSKNEKSGGQRSPTCHFSGINPVVSAVAHIVHTCMHVHHITRLSFLSRLLDVSILIDAETRTPSL